MRRFAWTTDSALDARAAAALFCALLPLFLGGIYGFMRIGFDNPARPIVSAIGLSWWINVIPFVLFAALNKDREEIAWYRSESFLSLAVLTLTALLGWLTLKVGLNPMLLLGVLATAAALFVVVIQVRRRPIGRIALFITASLLFALWIAGVEWANGYLNPLYIENLILHGGTVHIDTIFLAAIANMVQVHGVASVGMDGIPPIAYHYGSGWLFVQLANLIEIPVLRFYQLGVPLIIVPFFFRGILTVANEVRRRPGMENGFVPSLQNSWFGWLMLAAACIGILPPDALQAVAVWSAGPIVSESYATVIPVSLLIIGTLYGAWLDIGTAERGSIGANGFAFFILFVPLVLGATGFIKISEMLLLACAILWIFVRMKLWTRRPAIASALLSAALVVFAISKVLGGGRNNGISLLHFERTFIPAEALAFFPFMHLFWTWLYTALRLRETGVRTFADLRSALASRKLLDVEAVLVIALVGLLPGMLFDLWSDSYYFSDFQRWVSFALVLGLPSAFALFKSGTRDLKPGFRPTASISRTALFVVCIPFIVTPFVTTLSWSARLFRENLGTRREIQKLNGPIPDIGISGSAKQLVKSAMHGQVSAGFKEFGRMQVQPLTDPRLIRSVLQRAPRYAVVNTFLGAAALPLAQRKQTAIAIDDNVAVFWNILPFKTYCYFSAMTAPAVSGLPLVEGIPAGCTLPPYGGTEAYHEHPDALIRPATPDQAICVAAKRKGFTRVLRISETNGITASRTLVCGEVSA